jgi:hypothetical protein
MAINLSGSDITRFWSKVDRSAGPDACWPWIASRNEARGGYGDFNLGGVCYGAHRIAFFVASGYMAPNDTCHKCDNPPCCNPAHLYDGTRKQNAQDAARQGRIGKYDRRGERNPSAKLTAAAVEFIRSELSNGVSVRALADQFSVSKTAIYLIKKGANWPKAS